MLYDLGAQLGIGSQHAGVQHEVDAGLGDLGGQTLHQLDGLESQMGGAISPLRFQAKQVVPVRQLAQSVVGERWTRAVAHELLDARALGRPERHAAMQVEVIDLCAQKPSAGEAVRCGGQVVLQRLTQLHHGATARGAQSYSLGHGAVVQCEVALGLNDIVLFE